MINTGNVDHGEQIMSSIGSAFTKVTMQVISRSENGVLLGGAVYENYTGKGGSLLTHVAGFAPNWVNRDLLWVMFDYPFIQLDCTQAFSQVAAKNKASLSFCKNLGFQEVITLGGVFPDDDMILLRMKRSECRFLKIQPKTIFPRRITNDG